jgi:hypothetical protein
MFTNEARNADGKPVATWPIKTLRDVSYIAETILEILAV